MQEKLWHQTIVSKGRLTLFPDERTVRRCVRTLVRVARGRLVLFSLVDEHLHNGARGNREQVGNLSRGVSLALRADVGRELEATHTKPVETRAHLRKLVDYFLGQVLHHRLPVHPALWSGSCFLDLIGARVIDGLSLRLRPHLPRLRMREVYKAVGLPPEPIIPADEGALRRLGPFRIAEAAAASLAVPPELTRNEPPTVLARACAAQLAHEAGISRRDTADALRITLRAARRLLDHEVHAPVLHATRMRLSLEEAVAGYAYQRSVGSSQISSG